MAGIIGLNGPGGGIPGIGTATGLAVSEGGEIVIETGDGDFVHDLLAGRNPVSDFS